MVFDRQKMHMRDVILFLIMDYYSFHSKFQMIIMFVQMKNILGSVSRESSPEPVLRDTAADTAMDFADQLHSGLVQVGQVNAH